LWGIYIENAAQILEYKCGAVVCKWYRDMQPQYLGFRSRLLPYPLIVLVVGCFVPFGLIRHDKVEILNRERVNALMSFNPRSMSQHVVERSSG